MMMEEKKHLTWQSLP